MSFVWKELFSFIYIYISSKLPYLIDSSFSFNNGARREGENEFGIFLGCKRLKYFSLVVLGHARDIFLSRETLENPEGPDTGQRQRRGHEEPKVLAWKHPPLSDPFSRPRGTTVHGTMNRGSYVLRLSLEIKRLPKMLVPLRIPATLN